MRFIFPIILVCLIIFFVLLSINKHDKKINQMAESYEQCVRSQYGVSPAFWYSEHGEYPECK